MELKQLKRRHLVITLACAIAVAVVGALSKFIELGDQTFSFMEKYQESSAAPKLTQFALSENSYGYQERMEFIFAEGPTEIRTFGQVHPLNSPPSLVFQVTLQNPSSQELLATDITYKVTEIGEVKSLTPQPIESNKKYKHNIRWAVGDQLGRLVPVYSIPAKTTGSFEVEITTGESAPFGSLVIMTVLIKTSLGDVETEKFQVYLPVVKSFHSKRSERPPNTAELFETLKNIKIPPADIIDNIISISRISEYCDKENFDRLERDMLFIRAASNPFEEYLHAVPGNSNKPYAAIFPKNHLQYFWLAAREYFNGIEQLEISP